MIKVYLIQMKKKRAFKSSTDALSVPRSPGQHHATPLSQAIETTKHQLYGYLLTVDLRAMRVQKGLQNSGPSKSSKCRHQLQKTKTTIIRVLMKSRPEYVSEIVRSGHKRLQADAVTLWWKKTKQPSTCSKDVNGTTLRQSSLATRDSFPPEAL